MSDGRKPSRREFLTGQAAPDLSTGAEPTAVDGPAADNGWQAAADPTNEPYVIRVGRRAMACEFQIHLNAGQYEHATEAAIEALDRVEELEALLTVYRDDSQVSEINRAADGEATLVDPELFELIELSLRLYRMTDGAFDVTSGPLTEIWNSARRHGQLPTSEQIQRTRERIGSEAVHLDVDEQTVRFTKPGMSLNFGGIGKGYALDRAAEILENAGIHDFLFHGGRSSVIARGCRGGDEPGKPWSVGVVHPLRPERRLAEIFVRDRALSTSGSQTQSFTHQGRRYGHILDARTGMPSDAALSVTVLANTAAEADALSTALFVLGRDRGLEICGQNDGIAAVFVTRGSSAGAIDIEACNLESDEWTLLDD